MNLAETPMDTERTSKEVDYESGYHSKRHATHFNKKYYEARAKIAVKKFFSGVGENESILDFGAYVCIVKVGEPQVVLKRMVSITRGDGQQ